MDGEVVEGRASVDESIVTGESMPVTNQPTGDKVVGGTINTTGSFGMRPEKVGSDTLLAQIVQTVAAAMALLSVSAVGNAQRLRAVQL